MNFVFFLLLPYFPHGGQQKKQEPERKVHRVREEIVQLRSQKSNLEINLCDLNKVMLLWTGKLADIREAQSYYQAERSDAGSLALLEAEKHRLQVRLLGVSTKHRLPRIQHNLSPLSYKNVYMLQKVQEVQLRKDQELLNHQLQKAVLGRSGLNTKADIKTGVAHKTRIVKDPVDSNAWYKILSKEITKRRKVRHPGHAVESTHKKLSSMCFSKHLNAYMCALPWYIIQLDLYSYRSLSS